MVPVARSGWSGRVGETSEPVDRPFAAPPSSTVTWGRCPKGLPVRSASLARTDRIGTRRFRPPGLRAGRRADVARPREFSSLGEGRPVGNWSRFARRAAAGRPRTPPQAASRWVRMPGARRPVEPVRFGRESDQESSVGPAGATRRSRPRLRPHVLVTRAPGTLLAMQKGR